jgi:uncharacterized protein (DUF736 family)
MNIGLFTKNEHGYLVGNLPTLNLRGISLEPVSSKVAAKSPDYFASIEGAELGAAWLKTSKKGSKYLSFKVVVPGLPALWLAILSTKQEGQYVAAYSEPRKEAEADEASDL